VLYDSWSFVADVQLPSPVELAFDAASTECTYTQWAPTHSGHLHTGE